MARRFLTTSTLCATRAASGAAMRMPGEEPGEEYDRLFSLPVRDEDPRELMAELGDAGFIQFTVNQPAGLGPV